MYTRDVWFQTSGMKPGATNAKHIKHELCEAVREENACDHMQALFYFIESAKGRTFFEVA